MTMDEMDLVSQLQDVTPLSPEAYERARTMLRGAVADSGSLPEAARVPAAAPVWGRGSSQARNRRRRTLGTRGKVGIGAGVAAVAAAAAVALATTSAPRPATPAASASGAPAAASAGASAGPIDAQQQLVKLTDVLVAEPRPADDATLVERKTGAPGKAGVNVWDLYTDDGRYFFSQTEAGLPAQVQKNNNLGDGQFGREVAAATDAATGGLDAAALKMAWPYATPVPAWLSAQVKNMKASGALIDNYVWENSEDALIAGSGNPKVRAGVLRLVSALPDITVTRGTTDGQPTITLTAGKAELGTVGIDKKDPKIETGPAYEEAITINANTGIALQIASGPAGKVTGITTYVVKRVNLASIAAGKF